MNLKRLLIAALAFCFVTLANAQEKTVSGKVTDAKDGSALQGVSVFVKGSTKGTQTGPDGTFKIKVSSGATALTFSSVGFASQDVTIGTGDVFVKLVQNNASLNEVVVIGYGTTRKKDLSGSVTTVSSKDFVKGAITTPEQLISGKVAGVAITSNSGAPGSGSTIRIRGGASLNASNDPLIVVDGMPLDNGGISGVANPLSLINPNDIETFTILKDASATAIYGSRASNGVILITTKKGKSGKPTYSFSSQMSVASIAKKVDVFSADQIRSIVNTKGNASSAALLGSATTDWQNQIYQTALSQDNNLSVSGSLKKLPYRISVGFLNQDGILKTGNLQRTSLGINLSPMLLNNHLKIDLSLKGTYSQSRFANEGAIGSAVTFDPTQSVYSKSNRFGGYWEWLDPATTTGLKSLAPLNPLGLLLQRDDRSKVQRAVGNALIDYKLHFLPDLHALLNVGADLSEGKGTVLVPDSAASAYMRSPDKKHGGVNNQYRQTRQNTYLNFYFNYTKDIKSIKSRVEATAGYEYQDYLTMNYNFGDYTTDGTVISTPIYPFDKPENTLVSFMGRMIYTFDNKYILAGTIRRDGSSKFNPNNRWGTFPSGAFAWKIKEESFLKNVKAISDLKLRVSYGITGQQDGINNYDYISYYNLSGNQAEYQLGNNFYQMYRPGGYYYNRKWEQTATTNVALDYSILNGRVSGSVEYYYKKTTDLLNQINQPAGTNFSNKIVANIGSMENRGVEFTVNLQAIRSKDVTLDLAFNATYNQNKITKLTISDDPNYAGAQFGGISGGVGNTVLINSVGYNRGAFYVYKQVYDPVTNKPIDNLFADKNRDGIVNSADLYQYKGIDPKAFFGFSANLNYKKWNAGFVMRANVGNYVYNNVASSTGTLRNIINPIGFINNGSTDYLNTYFSGSGDKYFLSDYYVQNASFLRMDNINVGYNAGKIFNKRANLRVSANVQNVFVVTKYKGLDPEINGGIDNNFYPRPRTFVLGLNLDF
ncbi:SusC/RagA family TonB-linked outer membrane protein [Parasediminibacterium paludis]|uniref:SusC/RagA family TonB-linked outer membrane protein n=1 Tax=Parasediminibacterium paludis TaxID=908966 RepID=A0ABV8PUB6_9BACT